MHIDVNRDAAAFHDPGHLHVSAAKQRRRDIDMADFDHAIKKAASVDHILFAIRDQLSTFGTAEWSTTNREIAAASLVLCFHAGVQFIPQHRTKHAPAAWAFEPVAMH